MRQDFILRHPADVGNAEFRTWLRTLIDDQFNGIAGDLAAELNVSDGHISRALKGAAVGPEVVLKLAALTGEDASRLLRLASQESWASLIESCYGQARPVQTRPVPRALRDIVAAMERAPHLQPIVARFLKQLGELQPDRSSESAARPESQAAAKEKPRDPVAISRKVGSGR